MQRIRSKAKSRTAADAHTSLILLARRKTTKAEPKPNSMLARFALKIHSEEFALTIAKGV
jgi:hypothetical protein